MFRFDIVSWIAEVLLLINERLLNSVSILLKKRCCYRVVAEEVSSDINKIIFIRFYFSGCTIQINNQRVCYKKLVIISMWFCLNWTCFTVYICLATDSTLLLLIICIVRSVILSLLSFVLRYARDSTAIEFGFANGCFPLSKGKFHHCWIESWHSWILDKVRCIWFTNSYIHSHNGRIEP